MLAHLKAARVLFIERGFAFRCLLLDVLVEIDKGGVPLIEIARLAK